MCVSASAFACLMGACVRACGCGRAYVRACGGAHVPLCARPCVCACVRVYACAYTSALV